MIELNCLKTKFIVPSFDNKIILKREKLQKKILDNINSKLIYINAPAGFGKTYLLSQIINSISKNKSLKGNNVSFNSESELRKQESLLVNTASDLQGIKYFWISLSNDFNNQNCLYFYLRDSFSKILDQDLSLLDIKEENIQNTLIYLSNKSLDINEDIYFFIEDIHFLNQKHQNYLSYLIKNSSDNIHFILSSREKSFSKLSSLLINLNSIEIDMEDLKFSIEETQVFFDLNKVDISQKELNLIHNKTEGWILAISLAIPFIRKNLSLSTIELINNKYILNYFIENLIQELAPNIKDFILKTSIFNEFNYTYCNKLLGINNSSQLIKYLYKKNFFVLNIDDKLEWFRYHNLISEILIKNLESEDPILFNDIIIKASNILISDRKYSEALKLSVASKNNDILMDYLEKVFPNILLEDEKILEWLNIIKNIDTNYFTSRKKLLAFYLIALATQNTFDIYSFLKNKFLDLNVIDKELLALLSLSDLMILFNKRANLKHIQKQTLMVLKNIDFFDIKFYSFVYIQISFSYFTLGNINKLHFFIEKAFSFSNNSQTQILEINKASLLSSILLSKGSFLEAEKILIEYYSGVENNKYSKSYFLYFIYHNLSLIYLTWNDLPKLLNILEKYKNDILEYENNDEKFVFYYIMFNFNISIRNSQEALYFLEKMKSLKGLSIQDYVIEALKIKLLTVKKEFNKINKHYLYKIIEFVNDRISKKNDTTNHTFTVIYIFILLEFYLEIKDIQHAINFADSVLKYIEYDNSSYTLSKFYLILSILYEQKNKIQEAEFFMKESIQLSSKNNYVRIYIEKKEYIKNILTRICKEIEKENKETLKKSFSHKLLALITETNVTKINVEKINNPLSQKEKEIFLLLYKKLKPIDISENLNISCNTVKTYIRRIYKKLNVSTKKEAFIRAKYLGIIN